jgi:RNA polymerase sigma-32 factor
MSAAGIVRLPSSHTNVRAIREISKFKQETGARSLSPQQSKQFANDLVASESTVVRIDQYIGDKSVHNIGVTHAEHDALSELPEDDDETLEERLKRADDAHALIANALQALPNREAHIISTRYLREKKLTLRELASELGISCERVRQLEQNALKKLGVTVREQPKPAESCPEDERALRRAKYAREVRLHEFREARRKGWRK